MTFILSTITFLFWAISKDAVNGEGQYAIRFSNFKVCPDHKDTAITFHDLSINRTKLDSYVLKAKMVIHEDIPGPIYMGCYIERCLDEKKPDSCRYFMEKEFNDLCVDLKDPRSKGYDFVNNTLNIPNPSCPLPKGKYKFQTKPIDTEGAGDKIKMIQGEYKIWKMELFFWKKGPDGKRIVNSCWYLETATELKQNRERGQARNFNIFDKPAT